MSRRIRSNAPASLIFTSGARARASHEKRNGRENPILDGFRDIYDGDYYSWLDLYEATQWLRLAYDSSRIGGGIDPGVQLVGTLESAQEDNTTLGYVLGTQRDPESLLDGYTGEQIQDYLTHAEAVAKLALVLSDSPFAKATREI